MDAREVGIITQVAAKIASDLTEKSENTQETLDRYGVLLVGVTEMLFDTINQQIEKIAPAVTQEANIMKMVKRTFGDATSTSTAGDFTVTVQGEQHGDLPSWLIAACKRDGVTRVFDNRNQLADNPKRPWFKAVGVDKAYWEPKGKVSR
jgi:hypothetical protein